MRFVSAHAQDIGARESQQDSFGFGDQDPQVLRHAGFVAVLADGMGGLQQGEQASRAAVRAFLEAYRQKTEAESVPAALERSVRTANSAVHSLSRELGVAEGLGTTLVACVLHQDRLHWISVGDSNLYLCRDGGLTRLTRPHVFANLLEKAVSVGSLTPEQAAAHPERESLTSYIGAERIAEIDASAQPLQLEPGDVVMLASDGLFKTLDDAEIRATLTGRPELWPAHLVRRALAKQLPGQDNITVITVHPLGDPAAPQMEVDDSAGEPAGMSLMNWVLVASVLLAVAFLLYRTFTLGSLPAPVAAPAAARPGATDEIR
jgi:protein phosphatase